MSQGCCMGNEKSTQSFKGTTYQLPPLPYEKNALEPYISAEIMTLHYEKHHQTYVKNLNDALAKYCDAESKGDLPAMIALQQAIRFHGGRHTNHSIFWTNLAPQKTGGGTPPTGKLADAIQAEWGSLDSFIEKVNARPVAIQGSGWGWLGCCKTTK